MSPDCMKDKCRFNVNKRCARDYFNKDSIEPPSYCPNKVKKE